ncbi:LuxR C-terminal-related transcriptional regulator [Motilimonas cestriensis]|uniref:LuxR C-terminal-related transcriptional regulator n=1 Tax=Motilimonas cestriensis TaxID=2742685 RepID=A0ABS8W7N6_9GAMM|nr:LuxR C-terminal-related transcriptional regulator [Motilimonas cestriensis]MCE2594285.1 LuxR C-terminal-related transcriptional regulator [Motilimonas cestriensis]
MNKKQHLFLISEDSIESSALVHFLKLKLAVDVELISTPEQLSITQDVDTEYFFLANLQYISRANEQDWHHEINQWTINTSIILFNTDPELETHLLQAWPLCAGIFQKSADQEQLIKGIKCVFAGEYWFSRSTMTSQLATLRTRLHRQYQPYAKLTSREVEILKQVMTGASNMQIADNLFLSEHTVKSHLYNVFKKLKVKNRLQAVSWAREYI